MLNHVQCHIPASLLMDFQGLLYPNTYFPWIPEWYIEFSGDPLIGGLLRGEEGLVWFKCFLLLELCVASLCWSDEFLTLPPQAVPVSSIPTGYEGAVERRVIPSNAPPP